MQNILVTNIQRFSLHDGPGIRTTVFLKGCLLNCPWCCNPENISSQIQKFDKGGEQGVYGSYYTANELYHEVMKDKSFFGKAEMDIHITQAGDIEKLPGGVSFSGGECLLQIRELAPLCRQLKEDGIHLVIETSLYAPQENLKQALKYIDFFYVDIKILKNEGNAAGCYWEPELYLSNLDILLQSRKPIVFRVPVIGGYTDDEENRKSVAELISKSISTGNVLKIELVKGHNLASEKYKSLGYGVPEYREVSQTLLEEYRGEIEERIQEAVPIQICRI